jgi:hypothetical protein
MFRPRALRRRILEASRTFRRTSLRRPAQTTHVKWVLNTKGSTTQGCRLLTFIHCSAWRTASGADPPSPSRQGHPLTTRAHHDYSSRLWTLVPRGLAPRPGSLASGRPPPERVLAARRHPPPVVAAASPTVTSIGSGAPPAAS